MTPTVRPLYPATLAYWSDRRTADRQAATQPTTALPRTADKIKVLTLRLAAGESLFHIRDATSGDRGPLGAVSLPDGWAVVRYPIDPNGDIAGDPQPVNADRHASERLAEEAAQRLARPAAKGIEERLLHGLERLAERVLRQRAKDSTAAGAL